MFFSHTIQEPEVLLSSCPVPDIESNLFNIVVQKEERDGKEKGFKRKKSFLKEHKDEDKLKDKEDHEEKEK